MAAETKLRSMVIARPKWYLMRIPRARNRALFLNASNTSFPLPCLHNLYFDKTMVAEDIIQNAWDP